LKLVELTKSVKRIQVMSLDASKSRGEKAVQDLVKILYKNLDEEFLERMLE